MTQQEPTRNNKRAQRPQISGPAGIYTPELCRLIENGLLYGRTTCPNCHREIRYFELKKAACIYCGEEEQK